MTETSTTSSRTATGSADEGHPAPAGRDGTIALLHPGEMGAAIGAALVEAGKQVHWASAGRSRATRERALAARLISRPHSTGASGLV